VHRAASNHRTGPTGQHWAGDTSVRTHIAAVDGPSPAKIDDTRMIAQQTRVYVADGRSDRLN